MSHLNLTFTKDDFYDWIPIGSGSYSTIYKVFYKKVPKAFSLKVMNKANLRNTRSSESIKTECDLVIRLKHTNILRVYSAFEDETSIYFVQELGYGNLTDLDLSSLSFDDLRYYAAELVEAIAYLHQEKILHRDLKPENVLICLDQHIKIIDFGCAKLMAEKSIPSVLVPPSESPPLQPRNPSIVGSPLYVSPEVLEGKEADQASDIWSLACMLFYIYTGHPLFSAPTDYLLYQQIIECQYSLTPKKGQTFHHSLPEELCSLLSQILVKDPTLRLSIDDIKGHPFFEGIDWVHLSYQEPPNISSTFSNNVDASPRTRNVLILPRDHGSTSRTPIPPPPNESFFPPDSNGDDTLFCVAWTAPSDVFDAA
ncbi:putative 3-phosphoinositide-dependent protein kinase 1 [Blattamonas nauphoetae]|uniref:non-specific serine/threonine protein kinase n=1 Tax=Blattamonas nauphoetae TaxID=2049346 RepID=A0ABQ9XMW9_9EUKA|nr:putative 3-phosphoinositide-dependent protein kinase 1 [Blattamonas nauphoetae]